MPRIPKYPPQKSPSELREMTREGKQFAKIIGAQLAKYAVEAETRKNAASAHAAVIDKLDSGKRLSVPNPALTEQVTQERDTAASDYERSKGAVEALLPTKAKI